MAPPSSWQLFTAVGGLTFALGVASLAAPAMSSRDLLDALSAYAVAVAVFPLYAFVHRPDRRLGVLLLLAALGLALGGLRLWGMAPTAFRLAVIGWAFLTGCGGFALAVRFPEGREAMLLVVASTVALLLPFSLVLSTWREVLPYALGGFGLLGGSLLLALGLRLRRRESPAHP